jgi:hypothetical protein
VRGVKLAGGCHAPGRARSVASRQVQSGGMKSHAVRSLGAGMPGASGDEKLHGVPMRPRWAKLPGEVPWCVVDGSSPSGGSV